MIRHYVLTRAAYASNLWDDEANYRRLRLLADVTAPSLEAQDLKYQFTWVVLLNVTDPLYHERRRIVEDCTEIANIRLALTAEYSDTREQAAQRAYKIFWPNLPVSKPYLTTRIDDDDAFTPDAIKRIQEKAMEFYTKPKQPYRALIFPQGYRVYNGKYSSVRHLTNAYSTLYTPAGGSRNVYSYSHKRVREYAEVTYIDDHPAWLWVRHKDTISGHKKTGFPIDDKLMGTFPRVNWKLLKNDS